MAPRRPHRAGYLPFHGIWKSLWRSLVAGTRVTFVERLASRGIQNFAADTVGMAEADETVRDLMADCLKNFPQVQFGVHLYTAA